MSKSLGNQYTLRQLLNEGHDPVAIRYLLASVHYRKKLNFTYEGLGQAKAAVARLRDLVLRLEKCSEELPSEGPGEGKAALQRADEGFRETIADDLNTSGALGHMFSLVKATNGALDCGSLTRDEATEILAWFHDVDRIWALLPREQELMERTIEVKGAILEAVGAPISDDDFELITARMQARADRDFAAADKLRDRLLKRGISLEDTSKGVRWHVNGSLA